MADLQRRLFRPPLQPAHADQLFEFRSLALAWMYRIERRRTCSGIGEVQDQIDAAGSERHSLFHRSRSRLGRRRAHRRGTLALRVGWIKGGHLVGNRGVGMYGNWLYFLAPGWLVHFAQCERRQRALAQDSVADAKLQYFTTMAPMVVGNHVIVGVGGDAMDVPGYLEARDPETGALQWRWNTEPRTGEPGAETWPNKGAMEHGGGMTWLPGTYDPELNLLYWGTGNPNPVYAGQGRKGSNLWTCSIVALNPDTGKLVWYFQASPHDTHDWDNVETPVLFDGEFNGQPRKLLAQAARNGYFFVLDRTNGKN